MSTLRNTVKGMVADQANNQVTNCLLAWEDNEGNCYIVSSGRVRHSTLEFDQAVVEQLRKSIKSAKAREKQTGRTTRGRKATASQNK